MTYEEIVDRIFKDCEDEILDKDWKFIYDYIFSYKTINQVDYPDQYPSTYVFCKLLSGMLSPAEIIRLENKLDVVLYIYSLYFAGAKDVKLTLSKLSFAPNHVPYEEVEQLPSISFDSVTIDADCDSSSLYSSMPYHKINVKNLTLDIKDAIYASNSYKNFMVENLLIIKNFTNSDYHLRLPSRIKNLAFDPNVETLPNKIIAITYDLNLSTLILPEEDNLHIPRWINTVGDNCKIYKKKGQKIECYKNQTAWLKDHLISL